MQMGEGKPKMLEQGKLRAISITPQPTKGQELIGQAGLTARSTTISPKTRRCVQKRKKGGVAGVAITYPSFPACRVRGLKKSKTVSPPSNSGSVGVIKRNQPPKGGQAQLHLRSVSQNPRNKAEPRRRGRRPPVEEPLMLVGVLGHSRRWPSGTSRRVFLSYHIHVMGGGWFHADFFFFLLALNAFEDRPSVGWGRPWWHCNSRLDGHHTMLGS